MSQFQDTHSEAEARTFDRVISSRLGVAAAELIAKEDYGKMLIMKGYDVATLPLEKTAGKLKYVSPDDQIVLQAKHLGILLRRLGS